MLMKRYGGLKPKKKLLQQVSTGGTAVSSLA
jgi:hypothetical protein